MHKDSQIVDVPFECFSRYGNPQIRRVDVSMFSIGYFKDCMGCGFCRDRCCSYGVDVDSKNAKALLEEVGLAEVVVTPPDQWFEPGSTLDEEFPSGSFRRATQVDGACVFLNRQGRGCSIHAYCIRKGVDYHQLKPMVSVLFPLTFDCGLLRPADDVASMDLVCLGDGPSLYDGVREELAYYFGDALVSFLDDLRARVAAQ